MTRVNVCIDKPFEWLNGELFIVVPPEGVLAGPAGGAACWVSSEMNQEINEGRNKFDDIDPDIFVVVRGPAGTVVRTVESAVTYIGGDVLLLLNDVKKDAH